MEHWIVVGWPRTSYSREFFKGVPVAGCQMTVFEISRMACSPDQTVRFTGRKLGAAVEVKPAALK